MEEPEDSEGRSRSHLVSGLRTPRAPTAQPRPRGPRAPTRAGCDIRQYRYNF